MDVPHVTAEDGANSMVEGVASKRGAEGGGAHIVSLIQRRHQCLAKDVHVVEQTRDQIHAQFTRDLGGEGGVWHD